MSDPFTDAHQPANKPTGFSWWKEEEQVAYAQKIWDRGDRDQWLVNFLLPRGHITLQQAREALGVPGNDDEQLPLPLLRGTAEPGTTREPSEVARLKKQLADLQKACRYVMPYLDWTISAESPGHHPTMPSAVGAFKEALQACLGNAPSILQPTDRL